MLFEFKFKYWAGSTGDNFKGKAQRIQLVIMHMLNVNVLDMRSSCNYKNNYAN